MKHVWQGSWGYLVLILAGGMLYIAFEEWWKGLLLFIASVLIDIGLEKILLKRAKAKGEID